MSGKLNLVLLLCLLYAFVDCEHDIDLLPKMYELEDPNDCSNNNGIFCKISVILTPYNGTDQSEAWSIIEEAEKDYRYFSRDKVFHGRCLKKRQLGSLEEVLKNEYKTKYRNYSLEGNVQAVSCFEKGRSILNDVDYWDMFFISLGVFYTVFMIFATTITTLIKKKKDNFVVKVVRIFSLTRIWNELRKPIKNEDFQNLKSIQGIRTLTIMLIISLHAFYGNMFTFLRNPEFVENMYINLFYRTMITIFTFLVQSFFLISAWLLSNQLNIILKKNGNLSFKDILLIGLNRYCRIMPVVLVLIAALRSNLTYNVVSYIHEDTMKRETDLCRYSWWKNIFFIQNIYEADKICSGITWYVAADYQLYLLTLGLYYVSHKLRIHRNYFIGLVIIVTVGIQVTLITNTDIQGFLRLTPKTANPQSMLASREFVISYVPPWCNSITYMIGIVFANIYRRHKNQKLFNDTNKKILWFLGFFGLPILAIFVTSFQYNVRLFEMMVSIFARPVFAIGIGIGILGMATKTGGLVKIILESEPLVFLANFCYCVYLFHYTVVYTRILREEEMVDLSIFYIATYTFKDYTLSFVLGALVYITVEHPSVQLQKLILPQVTMKKSSLTEPTKPDERA